MKIQLNPNEQVVKAADSTFLTNDTSIRGKLILTTQRIYFKAEPNGSKHNDFEINPRDIMDILFFRDRLIFPQGLSIVTDGNVENRFLIRHRDEWSRLIVKMV